METVNTNHQLPPVQNAGQPQTPPPPSSSNSSKTFLLIAGAISLMIISAAGGYFIGIRKNQTVVQNNLPTSSPTVSQPSPTATPDETVNWKTYTNEKYGFETKYHPESSPNETIGNETVGQFTYLLLIRFGTNPLKFPHGYELRINKQSLDDYRSELIGHTTDKIDSEEKILVNGNTWVKINYEVFVTTDYAPITTAITNHAGYSYALTSSSGDIDKILSTFKFID